MTRRSFLSAMLGAVVALPFMKALRPAPSPVQEDWGITAITEWNGRIFVAYKHRTEAKSVVYVSSKDDLFRFEAVPITKTFAR
jgi:hypothetical protein